MSGYQVMLLIVNGTQECDDYIQSKHRVYQHVDHRVGKDLSLILKGHEQGNHYSCDQQASRYRLSGEKLTCQLKTPNNA